MPVTPPAAPPRLVVRWADVHAHELLRTEVARFHGVPESGIALGHACPRCGSAEHGRPYVRSTATFRHPAQVSLSRAGALSVVAITDAAPVGVDVEAVGAARFAGFDDVARHPDEHLEPRVSADRLWVRKEALLKAYGLGLAVNPSQVALDEHGIAAWDSPHPPPEAARILDVDVPGHVASVAVLTADGRGPVITAGPASQT